MCVCLYVWCHLLYKHSFLVRFAFPGKLIPFYQNPWFSIEKKKRIILWTRNFSGLLTDLFRSRDFYVFSEVSSFPTTFPSFFSWIFSLVGCAIVGSTVEFLDDYMSFSGRINIRDDFGGFFAS